MGGIIPRSNDQTGFERTMLRRKNKKGILLAENVLKIIIAALCIAVLVILGLKLFGMFSKENQVRKAEDSLNSIAEKITVLTSQEYTQDHLYVDVYPPKDKGWYIRSFKRADFPEKQCVGRFESCLCMCDDIGCKGLKACKGFEKETEVDGSESKEGSPPGGLSGIENVVVSGEIVTYLNTIELKNSIEELKISKKDNKMMISKSDRL